MLTALLLAAAQPAVPAPIPAIEEATTQIAALDAQLFWNAFEGCDAEPLEAMLTADFRMVHDLGGLVADGRDGFVGQIRSNCAAREPGQPQEGYKNRRLLTPGSRSVTPLGQWGVLERGLHTFHELRQRPAGTYDADDPGGPTWVQTGGARYLHIWQWMPEEARFRLNESISVDHGAAPAYPPAAAN